MGHDGVRSSSPANEPGFVKTFAAIILAVGIAVGGYFIGEGLYEARASQRFVTVKGLSERVVPADLAVWPIVFSVAANDLGTLQQNVEAATDEIFAFLSATFEASEYTRSTPRITDYQQQVFAPGSRPPMRYSAEATVTLRTSDIEAVQKAMQQAGDLVRSGVALLQGRGYRTEFFFTGLDAIKPEMIAEATKDARRAAEQFAEDSGSRVGSIRNAQQGYFSIQNRDNFSPEFKKIRVVTTVQYFLVDD